MKKYKVTFLPEGRSTGISKGTTIREAALACEIMLEMPCGGLGRCGKCIVRVVKGAYGPGPIDKKFINKARLKSGYRLACRTKIRNDMVIMIPDASRLHPQKILVGRKEVRYELTPEIQKVCLKLPKKLSTEKRLVLDLIRDRLKGLIGRKVILSAQSLEDIFPKLAEYDFRVTIVLDRDEVLGIESGDTRKRLFGMSFDIGTTTVVGTVIDLNKGKRLSLSARLNEQVAYGDDTISRISFTQINEDGLKLLNKKVVGTINRIIEEASRDAGIDRKNIYQITAVGNTVMHHLALSISPILLASPPYSPVVTEPFTILTKDLGIEVNPNGLFKFLPLIGGFVGADSVGLILSSQINRCKDIKLAVDIGTNGEVIMGSRKRLLVTSCAAGPAFEGAHISSGMRATDGAIESVQIQDDGIRLGVIGGGRPVGICGSGLIDAISELLRVGIIDQHGRMKEERFNLYRSKVRSIDITQSDVREVQLAKGAIRAGIEILKDELEIEDEDISEVLLAGSFGNYIRPVSAVGIGLIPGCLLDRIRFIANAPLRGAEMALCSKKAQAEAFNISQEVEHLNLSTRKNFQKRFAECMGFLKSLVSP